MVHIRKTTLPTAFFLATPSAPTVTPTGTDNGVTRAYKIASDSWPWGMTVARGGSGMSQGKGPEGPGGCRAMAS